MTQTSSQYEGTPTTQRPELSDSAALGRLADPLQPSAPDGGDTSGSGSTSLQSTAKDEAGKVSDAGVQAAKDVAGAAKEQASNVVAETRQQATSLLASVRSEVASQSGAQQERLAASLHSISQELGGLASGSQQRGPVTDLVEQAARRSGEFAEWLDSHEPTDLLDQVQSFARRRPVAFLALCGLAGVIAGRIARGATAASTKLDSGSQDRDLPRLADTDADWGVAAGGADTSSDVGSTRPGEVR